MVLPPVAPLTLVIVAFIAFGVGVSYLQRQRDRPGARHLGALLVVVAGWCGLYAATIFASSVTTMVSLSQLITILHVGLPPLWLSFTTNYTGRRPLPVVWWVPGVILSTGYVVGALFWPEVTLVWTDVSVVSLGSLEMLSFTNGPVYYAFTAYTYVFVLWGMGHLIQHAATNRGPLKYQNQIIVVALLTVLIPNIGYNTGISPFPFNPTPFAFTIALLFLVFADVQYGIFAAHPLARDVAREHVLEEMADGVVVVDRSLTITDVNGAATEVFDVDALDVVGRPLTAVAPNLAEKLAAGNHQPSFEYHGDGERNYAVVVSPFSHATSRFHGSILTLHDVTERRQHQARLAVFNRVLRHDIKNGLNVISGYADLLRDDATDGVTREEAADRIIARTDELLDLSNKIRTIEKGLDRHTECRTIGLMSVLEDVVDDVSHNWPEATISLEGTRSVKVVSPPVLESLFANLVENAAEHGGAAPHIDVTVTNDERGTTVKIADDGPGISAHDMEVIETRETQLHHSNGVGLWLVRWLTQRSNGCIEFETGESGTTVSVWFPPEDSGPQASAGEEPSPGV